MTTPEGEFQHGEALARLAAIVESSDDAIVSKTLDGIVTTWNKGAERIFGYTAKEIIGKSITILIPPDRQHEEPQILARLRSGERIDHYETIRMTKDGRLIDVSVTISPVRDATGRLVGASKVARDVTLQKRFQEELRVAKEAAESASRAKDQFLSVLSHELRTPLTPALGALSFLEANPVLAPDDLKTHVAMIRRNIEAEARLVDDLLDLTRIARGKIQLHFEVVDAHAAIRTGVAMFQKDIDAKRLSMTLALRAQDFHVWADPGRFQQVLFNLLSNALKFTSEEGSITIHTSNSESGELLVEVSDTGIGIEPDVLPRLFNAFEQGEQNVTRLYGGLGLGLSIVKSLMDLHHGTVTALSHGKDKGATFSLTFGTVEAEESSPVTAAQGQNATRTGRILLVEDHADTRQVMSMLLKHCGFIVESAGSVREAIQLAEQKQFDLLVSDIGLPDGSGVDIMKRIRASQNLKGIAVSGFGQDEDVRRSYDAGFETHLVKPVNLRMLQEAVQNAVK